MPTRNTESTRTTLAQERADLDATRAAMPGWHVWATWNCGTRTWHAVPDFPGSAGPAADHLAQTAPGRITAATRHTLIAASKGRRS